MRLPDKVILIGMPGSGKTTLGKQIAESLSLPFFDLDSIIEASVGKSIKSIFKDDGEEHFRKIESEAIRNFLSSHTRFIMSSGGGTPCFFDNMDRMVEVATVVFIDVPESTLVERLHTTNIAERPLLSGADLTKKIKNTLDKRRVFYERAHFKIAGSIISAPEVISLLEKES
ncbi:shikimate kinase [Fulvivirga lutimaris]|uniref:shikimate kinase n=1 Tax=Fulvivirga lutimaris TaxID=1819566 RepID=UPI001627513D|nr:shikimate kinase [Fulvivirga lutimaris]